MKVQLPIVETTCFTPVNLIDYYIEFTDQYLVRKIKGIVDERDSVHDMWNIGVKRHIVDIFPKEHITSIEIIDIIAVEEDKMLYALRIHSYSEQISLYYDKIKDCNAMLEMIMNWKFKY